MDKQEAVVFHQEGEQLEAVTFAPEKKSAEQRKYLLLLDFMEDEDGIDSTYFIAHGRTEAYFKIKYFIDEIDVDTSIVILEGKRCLVEGEYITVLQFLRHIRDNELVEDSDPRDIDDIILETLEEE